MRILVLVNTPAHAHLYRNVVGQLEARDHDVTVLARDHGCTLDVLDWHGIDYTVYGSHEPHSSVLSFGRELAGQFRRIASSVRSERPDVVFGRGPYAAFAGTVARAPTVLVLDDEPTAINHTVSRPFADCIVSPVATRRDLGEAHLTFDGLTETAYLHPAVWEPDPDVRDELEVGSTERLALVRFNAHEALHDGGLRGFTHEEGRALVRDLAEDATVFVSDEGDTYDLEGLPARPLSVHPARIHDVLAAASLFVTDTGTMAVEAALVGTPSLRYQGTDDREYGEYTSLERAGLLEQFADVEALHRRATGLVDDDQAILEWEQRREAVLESVPDLTETLVTVAECRGSPSRVRKRTPLTPRRAEGR